jgi:hypothetical protein
VTALGVAIERRQWQLASLYLLLGVNAAASKLPRESLTALIDVLGGLDALRPEAKRDR